MPKFLLLRKQDIFYFIKLKMCEVKKTICSRENIDLCSTEKGSALLYKQRNIENNNQGASSVENIGLKNSQNKIFYKKT